MKTVIRISTDYNGDCSIQERNDNIYNLVNDGGIQVHCEISNDRIVNIVEDIKNYSTNREDFKNVTIVDAVGYSQGDWQQYSLYHNEDEDSQELGWLVDELKKSFTHYNDYIVEKFDREEINGKNFDADPHDYTSFCVRHIEFPDKEDVLKEYIAIYGEDYDEVEICID